MLLIIGRNVICGSGNDTCDLSSYLNLSDADTDTSWKNKVNVMAADVVTLSFS